MTELALSSCDLSIHPTPLTAVRMPGAQQQQGQPDVESFMRLRFCIARRNELETSQPSKAGTWVVTCDQTCAGELFLELLSSAMPARCCQDSLHSVDQAEDLPV